MTLDLPLVRGTIDPAVSTRENTDPIHLALDGQAHVIAVDEKGHILLNAAQETDNQGRIRLAYLSHTEAREWSGRGRFSYIGKISGRDLVSFELPSAEAETVAMNIGGFRWEPLRLIGHLLSGDEAAAALMAIALASWHASFCYCPTCGKKTEIISGGWVASCTGCGRLEYPRHDPAVIALVEDHDGRVLLAHNALWPGNMVSLIAGYVEVGESPDKAVAREIDEEVNIAIESPQYVATQPWPFGRSQMMGYRARTRDPHPTPTPDGTEIEWARFYSRNELREAVESGAASLPGPISIAYALLRSWYGDELPNRGNN